MTTTTAPVPAVDPYARSADLDDTTADALAARLEIRATEPQQRALRRAFLSRLPRRPGTRALEVGCGTGIVSRELAALPGVVEVVGIDPCLQFIARARAAAVGDATRTFEVADGRAVPYADETFDVVVFATTLCHVPGPDAALAEAHRVLRPGGTLLVFDGDYATTTVATTADDPLQACVAAAVARLVHDPYLVRRLRLLATAAGFTDLDMESHGYIETASASYTPTIVDFGVSALASEGAVGEEVADALRAEARRRMAAGTYFGHIAYASLLATRS